MKAAGGTVPDNEFLLPTILAPDSSGIVAKLPNNFVETNHGWVGVDVLPTRHAYGHLGWSLSLANGRTPTVGPADEWMDARICIPYETRAHTYGRFAHVPILPCRSV